MKTNFFDIIKDNSVNGFILADDKYQELKKYVLNLEQENYNLLKKSYKDDVIITRAISYVKEYLYKEDEGNLLEILEGSKNDNI